MSDDLFSAVSDVVAYLALLSHENVSPRDAQGRLRSVQDRHPDVDLELVWDEEAFDHSRHFDVLLRPASGGTLSLSFAGDRGLPWPLRGVKRWTDANLVQVNGRMLTMEEAVAFLDVLWNEAPLMERMVNACLVRDELTQHPIDLHDNELQRGLDGLRRSHGLYTAEATMGWMQLRGLTQEQLEHQVSGALMCAKLRRRVAEDRVESYFESNRRGFDTVHVAQIECTDEDAAQRIQRCATHGNAAQLAEDGAVRIRFAHVYRRDLEKSLQDAIFESTPGAAHTLRVPTGFEVTQIFSVTPAVFDDRARETIEKILFDEWLAERRSSARICWHWGHANHTARAA